MYIRKRVLCMFLAVLMMCVSVSATALADVEIAEEVQEISGEAEITEVIDVIDVTEEEETGGPEEEGEGESLRLLGTSQTGVKLNKTRLIPGTPIVIDSISASGPFTYQWYVYGDGQAKGKSKSSAESYTPSIAEYEKWIEVDVYTAGGAEVGSDRVYFSSTPVVYIDSASDRSSLTSDLEVAADLLIQGNSSYGCQYNGGIGIIAIDDNTAAAGTEKPFRIELTQAASLFGFTTASYYVLIPRDEYEALPDLYTYPDGITPVKMEVRGIWTELVYNGNVCGSYRLCEYSAIAYFNSAASYPRFPATPGFDQVRSYWLYNTLFDRTYTPGYYYLGANSEKVYVGFAQTGKTTESYLTQWAAYPYFLIKSAEQYWLTRDEILENYGFNITTLYFGYGYPGTPDAGELRRRINILDAMFFSEDMVLENIADTYNDNTYRQAGQITASGNLRPDSLTPELRAPADGLVPDNTPAVLELSISNTQTGSVLVYVNGEKYTEEKGDAEYPVKNGKVNLCISSDALNADFGTKNIVSFIQIGKNGSYMTDAAGRVLTDYISIIKTDAVNAENYTVSFESNGGSQISPQPVSEGACASKPLNPEKAGHVFVGWYEDADLTIEYSFAKPVTADRTLYARWNKAEDIAGKKFTVSFVTNGGLPMQDVRVDGAEQLDQPADPTKNGHIFLGWYTDEDLLNPYDFASYVVSDFTLYARWKKDPAVADKTYTVTFETYCPMVIPQQSVKGAEYIVIPADPEMEGYDFLGWYGDAQMTELFDFTVPVTEDHALYARWNLRNDAPVRTVTFEVGISSTAPAQQSIINGKKAEQPAAPAKNGHIFLGWYTEESCTNLYDFNAYVVSDLTLYAGWEKDPAVADKTYTVTFETYCPTVIPQQSVKGAEYIVIPADPEMEGYDFLGWYGDAQMTELFDFIVPVTEDHALYARWNLRSDAPVRTVTFEVGISSTVPAQQSIINGKKAEQPAAPAKNGHIFLGWYTDASCTTLYDFNAYVVSDLTLYAGWKKDPAIADKTYTIIFEADCPNAVPQQSVNGAEYIVIPETPVKEGYDFLGWYGDAQMTELFDFIVPVTEDHTLYARWNLRSDAPVRTVEFRTLVDNRPSLRQGVINGQKVNKPVVPTRSDFDFVGWFTDEKCETPYDFEAPVYTDLILYAKWQYVARSSGSSGGGGGGGTAPSLKGITGTWTYTPAADTWTFTSSGKTYKNEWAEIRYDTTNPYNPKIAWFRFDADGKMLTGWYTDEKGQQYYLNPLSTGSRGAMLTGWQQIDGVWYYFKESPAAEAGQLLKNGTAPDGFRTDAQGRRIG